MRTGLDFTEYISTMLKIFWKLKFQTTCIRTCVSWNSVRECLNNHCLQVLSSWQRKCTHITLKHNTILLTRKSLDVFSIDTLFQNVCHILLGTNFQHVHCQFFPITFTFCRCWKSRRLLHQWEFSNSLYKQYCKQYRSPH